MPASTDLTILTPVGTLELEDELEETEDEVELLIEELKLEDDDSEELELDNELEVLLLEIELEVLLLEVELVLEEELELRLEDIDDDTELLIEDDIELLSDEEMLDELELAKTIGIINVAVSPLGSSVDLIVTTLRICTVALALTTTV